MIKTVKDGIDGIIHQREYSISEYLLETNIRIDSIELDSQIYKVGDKTNYGRINYIDIEEGCFVLQIFNYNCNRHENYILPNSNIQVFKKLLELDNGILYDCDLDKEIKLFYHRSNNNIASVMNIKLFDYLYRGNKNENQKHIGKIIMNTDMYELNHIKFDTLIQISSDE